MAKVAARTTRGEASAIDLFAGCGGLSLGLVSAGFRVKAAVEIDAQRAKTYSSNHPATTVFQRDIRGVCGEELLAAARTARGRVDLVAGCPPCQGFSRIRRRNGKRAISDTRNDLVTEFGRLILEIRPRAVMMENVPGLETDHRFAALIRSLRGAGYKIAWEILDLEQFGIPQRRRRLVVIGWRGKWRPNLEGLPKSKPRTVREAIAKMPRIPKAARSVHGYKTFRSSAVKERIKAIPRNGGSRGQLPDALVLKCHQKGKAVDRGFRDVYGRMRWDDVSPTITGGCINPSKGRFLHPVRDRAITLLEAARLQTFPIWYRFDRESGKYPVAEMIGEALPPRFARIAGTFIAKFLRSKGQQR